MYFVAVHTDHFTTKGTEQVDILIDFAYRDFTKLKIGQNNVR